MLPSAKNTINTVNAQYLPNAKAYKLQTRYTCGVRRPVLLTRSKVKIARSRYPPDRCWPISRERNVLEIPKLLGRLPTLRAILHTCFRVKRSKIKVSRDTESVSYLRSGKAYELKNGTPMEHAINCHGQL